MTFDNAVILFRYEPLLLVERHEKTTNPHRLVVFINSVLMILGLVAQPADEAGEPVF